MAVTSVISRQIVNLESDTNYYFEVAPQGDGQARYVDLELLKNNSPYNLSIGNTVILEGKNAGGYNVFISCEYPVPNEAANVVRVPLINGVLAIAGVGKYQVGIYDHSSYIHSFPLNIVVTEAPYDMDRLQHDDVYEALYLAIAKAMASNKWIVGDGDPTILGIVANEDDYYLDSSNGNLWICVRDQSVLQWEPVLDSASKQSNIMEKIYIRYSMNADGNPMYPTPYDTSTTPPTVRDYIGFFVTTDLSTASSVSNPSSYVWHPLRIDVTDVTTQYAKNNSYTTHPTTGWSNTVPLIIGNSDEYLWTKVTLHLKDGNSFDYYTVTQYGKYGDFGAPTSSIDEAIGQPEVTVTVDPTSPSTAKIFDFNFKIRGGHWKYGTDVSGTGSQTVTTLTSADTVIGDMYLNTTTGTMYRCNAVTASDSTWEETRELRGTIWRFGTDISGTGTQTTTAYDSSNTIMGDVYVNTSSDDVYECIAVTPSNSTWRWCYAFSGSISTLPGDLANTVRYYRTLNPGETTLTFQENDPIFSASDALGDTYYYHIKFLSSKPNVGSNQNFEAIISNGQIDVTLPFKKAMTRNMEVLSPSGDPSAQGWYEADATSATGYSLTSDTSVVTDKKYYAPVTICMEIVKKTKIPT